MILPYLTPSLPLTSPRCLLVAVAFSSQSSIPRGALIDSGYAVTGGVSPRAQLAISALAQALEQDGMVAVARFVKVRVCEGAKTTRLQATCYLTRRSSLDADGGRRSRGRHPVPHED